MWTAASPMVGALLRDLSDGADVRQRVLDEGDAVVQLSAGPALTAVVFPTAETLSEARACVPGVRDTTHHHGALTARLTARSCARLTRQQAQAAPSCL